MNGLYGQGTTGHPQAWMPGEWSPTGGAAPRSDDSRDAAPALQAHGVRVSYGRQPVISNLDLSVAARTITALCGPNGSGKSTLLKALSGLLAVNTGELRVAGQPLQSFDRRSLARRIAFLPQQPLVPEGLTVREVVSLGRFPHRPRFGRLTVEDTHAIDRALEQADIASLAGRRIEQLSGGERQRAWLALTLAQEADILLLDEPTTFLDPQHQIGTLRRIRELTAELALTVVWVLHDLNHAAAYSDRLVLLESGSIAAEGRPGEVLTENRVRQVFGLDTLIIPHPETGRPLCVPREGPSTSPL